MRVNLFQNACEAKTSHRAVENPGCRATEEVDSDFFRLFENAGTDAKENVWFCRPSKPIVCYC